MEDVCVHSTLSHSCRVRLSVTPRVVARQAPLSMGFSRQECWSGLPCPPPADPPNPGIKPASPVAPKLAGVFLTVGAPWEAQEVVVHTLNGILLSYKKEGNNVICCNVGGPRDCHSN